ncbi:hypothetical protein TRFO_19830 [Tritrichomonas foetus]|uniref:Uncharacterized protein n=1 Tax=Tritrichomonas foetus TaxID=1144522 RepID=A0A1J4KIM3_9EUKA|nr:hypothetical protein TRFO_19830 [Tritrichomonas foetus]|eukprot:OHT10776.1 hypothetical protein TRFO_19830 [Tritrichomonas foetus]
MQAFTFSFNERKISTTKAIASSLSDTFKEYIHTHPNETTYYINMIPMSYHMDALNNIFTGHKPEITPFNISFLTQFAETYQICSLQQTIFEFKNTLSKLDEVLKSNSEYQSAIQIENYLYNCSWSFEEVKSYLINVLKNHEIKKSLICHIILGCCISHPTQIEKFISLILALNNTKLTHKFIVLMFDELESNASNNSILSIEQEITYIFYFLMRNGAVSKDDRRFNDRNLPSLCIDFFDSTRAETIKKKISHRFGISNQNYYRKIETKLFHPQLSPDHSIIRKDKAVKLGQLDPSNTIAKNMFEQCSLFNLNPTYFDVALFYGSENALRIFSRKGSFIAQSSPIYAIAGGNEKSMDYLKNQKIKVSFQNTLPTSVQFHNFNFFRQIFDSNSDTLSEDLTIKLCFEYGNIICLNHILKCGLNIKNIFFQSIKYNYVFIAKIILDLHIFNANITTANKSTPLHIAAQSGFSKMVKFLLKQNDIDVNFCNADNETPLHLAVAQNQQKIVDLLIHDDNINPNIRDSSERTPLYLSVTLGNLVITQLLLSNPNTDEAISKSGKTAFQVGKDKNDEKIISLFQNRDDLIQDFHRCNSNHNETLNKILSNPNLNPNNTHSSYMSDNFNPLHTDILDIDPLSNENYGNLGDENFENEISIFDAFRNNEFVILEKMLKSNNVNTNEFENTSNVFHFLF